MERHKVGIKKTTKKKLNEQCNRAGGIVGSIFVSSLKVPRFSPSSQKPATRLD